MAGYPFRKKERKSHRGPNTRGFTYWCGKGFGERKNDHKIINAALKLKDEFPEQKVVLVIKDICLRVKAKSLNLHAEDYETGKVKDVDDLYTGKSSIEELDASIIDDLAQDRIIDYKRFQKTKPTIINSLP